MEFSRVYGESETGVVSVGSVHLDHSESAHRVRPLLLRRDVRLPTGIGQDSCSVSVDPVPVSDRV